LWRVAFRFVLVGFGHVFAVEGFNVPNHAFAIGSLFDAFQLAICKDVAVIDRDGTRKTNAATIAKIGERLPNPIKVLGKNRLIDKGFDLNALLLLDLSKPLGIFSLWLRRPAEIGY